MLSLIYIGSEFYVKSSTMMSSIYTVDGRRSDWGKVSIALEKGEEVHIRPATRKEMSQYRKMLAEWKAATKKIDEEEDK
uniref:Uncharacterized protein n=1 Tax=viral metagenome TaxID=1070528 RepID=A0A6H2A654_9ZZZZ